MSVRVALIGANGHGLSHRRTIAPLHAAGTVTLVGMCDLAPITHQADAPIPPGTALFRDYRDLLAATGPEVVVICTPPHTHLEIATAAAHAGADLLLEKPPLTSLDEHHALARVLAQTGRLCQVGFQALGSAALAELTTAVATGALGRVTGVSAVGAWQRPDSYYARAPWAGKRWVDGRPVLDGALANPFAHAVMQCLAVAAAAADGPVWPVDVEVERYRARPIEVDDTAVLRARLSNGLPVLVAVSLCADDFIAGEIIVHSDRGRAVLGYATDDLRLPGETTPRSVPGRTGLLEDLVAHRAAGRAGSSSVAPRGLVAPLSRTAGFTALVEALTRAPEPHDIDPSFHATYGEGPERIVTVPGLSRLLRTAATEGALPNMLGADWAAPAWRTALPATTDAQHNGGQ